MLLCFNAIIYPVFSELKSLYLAQCLLLSCYLFCKPKMLASPWLYTNRFTAHSIMTTGNQLNFILLNM